MLRHAHNGARRRGLDIEFVHQASRADQPHAETGFRLVAALKDLLQVRDARSRIGYCNLEPLRRFQDQGQRHFPIARIPERISSNLRCGGRQPNLILIIQSKFRRHFASTLPCVNDVSFGEESDMDDRNRQESRCFRYDDAHIIALPAVVAEQCASDNGGVAREDARICREIPLCLQPIRMQHKRGIRHP